MFLYVKLPVFYYYRIKLEKDVTLNENIKSKSKMDTKQLAEGTRKKWRRKYM